MTIVGKTFQLEGITRLGIELKLSASVVCAQPTVSPHRHTFAIIFKKSYAIYPYQICVAIYRGNVGKSQSNRSTSPIQPQGLVSSEKAGWTTASQRKLTGWDLYQLLQMLSPTDWLKRADIKIRIVDITSLGAKRWTNSQLTRILTSTYAKKWATQRWRKPFTTWSSVKHLDQTTFTHSLSRTWDLPTWSG